jgi:hypothetical protein
LESGEELSEDIETNGWLNKIRWMSERLIVLNPNVFGDDLLRSLRDERPIIWEIKCSLKPEREWERQGIVESGWSWNRVVHVSC